MQWAPQKQKGFTIVELLIVVVVIAILAVITIVAYNGVTNRAKSSAVNLLASQVHKKLSTYATLNNETYPVNLTDAGIDTATSTKVQYSVNNTSSPRGFCITATQDGTSAYVAQTYSYNSSTAQTLSQSTPLGGACPGHAANGADAITNYVINPSFETAGSTGYLARSSATIAIVTSEAHSGTSSLRSITPGSVSDEGVSMSAVSGVVESGGGGIHRGSAWVKATNGANMRIQVEEYTTGGTYVGGASIVAFTGTGGWQFVTNSKSITAGNRLRVIIATNSTAATTFYVDDFMVTSGSVTYTYADGNSPGWIWNGPIGNSTSKGQVL